MATSGAWQRTRFLLAEPLRQCPPTAPQLQPVDVRLRLAPAAAVAAAAAALLGPLHEPLFRTLWIAAVVSYTGTWMQNVGAAWLMTSLTMSPLMVGLVQAAGSIAVFLVVLPAGAIADVVDRRKLSAVHSKLDGAGRSGAGALTLAGKVTPTLLLLFTFLMGFGAVLNDPAWQAITPGSRLASQLRRRRCPELRRL